MMANKHAKTDGFPAPTITLQATETTVQNVYSDKVVLGDLQRKHVAGMSLRQIAAEYSGITHADIQRALSGKLPHHPHKRQALHLAPMLPAPACAKCGQVHVTKRCTSRLITWRAIADMPIAILLWKINNRREW